MVSTWHVTFWVYAATRLTKHELQLPLYRLLYSYSVAYPYLWAIVSTTVVCRMAVLLEKNRCPWQTYCTLCKLKQGNIVAYNRWT